MTELPLDLPDLSDVPKPPTLVFLHGTGQMPLMWQNQVEALGEVQGAVMAAWQEAVTGKRVDSDGDQLGILAPWVDGLRPGQERHLSTERAADALVNDFEVNGISSANLVGHQYGAMVALQVALVYPQRVNRLVLSGATLLLTPMQLRFQKAAIRLAPRAQFDAVGISKDELIQTLELMASTPLAQRCKEIEVPTLLLASADDQAGAASMQFLAEQLPHAELRLLSGSSPNPMEDAADAYNAALVEFLGL